MRRFFYFLLVFSALFILSYNIWYFTLRQAKAAAWQEVLLRGGTVIDGSGGEPYEADLLIRGSRIVALGKGIKPSPGARVIDVGGSLVVPGMVAVRPGLLPDGREQEALAAAGITTVIGGADGDSPLEIKKYLDGAARNGLRINFGTLLGMGSLRGTTLNPGEMNPAEGEALRERISRGLSEGALGLSLDFNKLPDAFWSWEEIGRVCTGLRPSPLLVVDLPDEVVSGEGVLMPELRALLKAASAAPFRPYLKSFRLPANLPAAEIRAIREMLEQATAAGVQLWGDLNPFPPAGRPRHLLDTAVGRFAPEDLVIVEAPPAFRNLVGKSLTRAAEETGLPVSALTGRLTGKDVRVEVVETGGEAALAAVPFFCWQGEYGVSRGVDALPVNAGSYTELLARKDGYYGMLPLPEKVRRLTSLPARVFGLKDRGRIAPNAYADLLVLRRRGNGYTPDYVFVNGRPAVLGGKTGGFKAGRVLRGP